MVLGQARAGSPPTPGQWISAPSKSGAVGKADLKVTRVTTPAEVTGAWRTIVHIVHPCVCVCECECVPVSKGGKWEHGPKGVLRNKDELSHFSTTITCNHFVRGKK